MADPARKDLRIAVRLAWNGWPDNDEARREMADLEARGVGDIEAWDRVAKLVAAKAMAAKISEREACAVIADEHAMAHPGSDEGIVAANIAAEIRGR